MQQRHDDKAEQPVASVEDAEQEKVELVAHEQEDFRSLAESIPQLVWVTQADGYHEYFNQHWYDYTNTTLEQTRGEGWSHLLHPDDYARTLQAWRHSLETGDPYEIEYRFRNGKTGEYRWFIGRALPVKDEQGRILKWFGTCTDIDEQKRTEEALRQLERRKDEFISMASHELKTPITTLKGLTQLLKRKFERQGLTEPVQSLSKMETQINKLTKLVSDLLDVSKIQAGRLEYAEEIVDIDALMRDIVETGRQTTTTHSIVLHGKSGKKVIGDSDRLGQVFLNLISNAIKYSPQADNVDIEIAAAGDEAIIRVCDYGVGIPEEHQGKIFERFYRVYDDNNKAFPGLGMGLYISCEIVKRHGGDITVKSEEGKGSVFSVSLPAITADKEK